MKSFSVLELDLLSDCESGWTIGRRVLDRLSATGEPYVVLCGYGAAYAAKKAFDEYAAGKSGTLYWRIYPELEDGKFYMRLLISDRTPLPEMEEEAK